MALGNKPSPIVETNYTRKEQWEKNLVRGEGRKRTGRIARWGVSESLQLSDKITSHFSAISKFCSLCSLWTGSGWKIDRFSLEIFGHVTRVDHSRASEKIWWIIISDISEGAAFLLQCVTENDWKEGRRIIWPWPDDCRPFFLVNSQLHHACVVYPTHNVHLLHNIRPNGDTWQGRLAYAEGGERKAICQVNVPVSFDRKSWNQPWNKRERPTTFVRPWILYPPIAWRDPEKMNDLRRSSGFFFFFC